MADAKIKIDLIVDDKGTVKVKQFGRSVTKLSTDSGSLGKKMAAAAVGVGRLTTAVAGAALKVGALSGAMAGLALGKGITTALSKFSEFEVALLKMGNVTSDSLDEVRSKIMALPAELGTATELMQGYYQVMSAGVTEPAAALDMLTTAAKASQEANVEMGDVVKGLAAVMGTYGNDLKTAADAADLLYQMEAKGILQVQELIPYIGNLANVSEAAGLSANEMGAALAQVSTAGQGTSIAVTQLQSLVAALSKKFDSLPESIKKYGSAAEAVKAIGFEGVLKEIWDSTEGNSSALIKLLGRQEAYMALLQLAKVDFKEYGAKFDEMKEKTGSFADAWERFSSTLSAKWAEFKNVISNQLILIGEKLAPVVGNFLEYMSQWIEANEALIQAKIDEYLGRIGTELKNVQDKIKEHIGSWEDLQKIYSEKVAPTLEVIWIAISGLAKVFLTVGDAIGYYAAQISNLFDRTSSLWEFIQGMAKSPAIVMFEFWGKGSTELPLTEKIAEMTDKMAGFSTGVNNLQTKAVVDFIGNVNGSEMSLSDAAAAAQEAVNRISASGSNRLGGLGPSFSTGAEGYKEMSDLYFEAMNTSMNPDIRDFYRKMGQQYLEFYYMALKGQNPPTYVQWETGTGTRGLPYSGTFYGHQGEIVLNKQESEALRGGGNLSSTANKTSNVTKNYHITIAPQFMSGDRSAASSVAKEIKRELVRLDHRYAN